MAIVPFTKSPSGSLAPAQAPSETNLLMALADMHRQGRLGRKPDPEALPPPETK